MPAFGSARVAAANGDTGLIRNNQRRRRGGGNNGPRPQQMGGGNNYGNRLDNRQRGNATQLLEKYRALARDAQQAGDRVTAEYYLQYAEHYYRVLGDYRDRQPQDQRRPQSGYDEDMDEGADAADDADDAADEGAERGEPESRREGRGDTRSDNRRDDRRDDRDAPRNEQRSEQRSDQGNERRGPRGRDRQDWNRSRDDGRDQRSDSRDDSRGDQRGENRRPPRQDRRDRAPDLLEAADHDEGPIPGLPGPARMPAADGETRTLRIRREPAAAPVEAAAPEPATDSGEDAPAPRRRGRPRKTPAAIED